MGEGLQGAHGEAAAAAEAGPEDPRLGSDLSKVSRTMVGLYKEFFGRGPTQSRCDWAGADTLVCTLEQSLTSAERNLLEMGEHQRLRDVRMLFQYATVKKFVEPVEEITGRTVRSFVSGIDAEKDVSVELFVFYPIGEEGPSRARLADAARDGA